MRHTTRTLLTLLILLGSTIIYNRTFAQPPDSFGFADPAFETLWNRTDLAVQEAAADQNQEATTSWLWGPKPLTAELQEPYAQAPTGSRLVQYFDKARMEITNPERDRGSLWFVTNGLLPIELITGRVQIGGDQFEQRQPALIAAIGDPDNPFPTYADLATVFTEQGAGDQLGNPVTGFLAPDGSISDYDAYQNDPATQVAIIENEHGIPAGFLDYMTEQSRSLGRLFVFGYPVSGAYWTTVRVGGNEQPVMFQVFERRVLTYTPNNPTPFQIEAGNVGLHYLQWRYPTPTLTVTPPEGPRGTTFTIEVTGLPTGEEALLRITPAPIGAVREFTVTGSDEPVQVNVPTTPDDSIGNWSVLISRSTISPALISVTGFTVTSPE